MEDPRIPINANVRKAGFLIGFLLIIAGLVLGWLRSGQPIQLPPTGYKPPDK
jgi:uncharacterized membrane protein YagU involved in acid resistance